MIMCEGNCVSGGGEAAHERDGEAMPAPSWRLAARNRLGLLAPLRIVRAFASRCSGSVRALVAVDCLLDSYAVPEFE